MPAGVFITELEFSDGTKFPLASNSILALTGPNNSGKSSVLREIGRAFDRLERRSNPVGPVLKRLTKGLKGQPADFEVFLKDRFEYDSETNRVTLRYQRSYLLKTILSQVRRRSLPAPIETEFMIRLSTRDRLGGGDRQDGIQVAASILQDDEPSEIGLSRIFRRAFGRDLILDRTSDGPHFHLGDRNELPLHADRLKPSFRKWMDQLPLLSDQGDGTRSFSRVVLDLLVVPGSLILIDEPEAFLHPPQIRQLARVIATQTPPDTQIICATHSDDFMRGLLDASVDRVTVARMERRGEINPTTILDPVLIQELWHDPLLRTSGLLSALFHDVAVICEGESDARFFQALMEATEGEERDPDYRFYHCGGKDRIPGIAKALRAVKIPTITMVDIDLQTRVCLSDYFLLWVGISRWWNLILN